MLKKTGLDISDGLAAIGVALIVSGLWMIYRPAAFVSVGIYLLLCSLAAGRSRK